MLMQHGGNSGTLSLERKKTGNAETCRHSESPQRRKGGNQPAEESFCATRDTRGEAVPYNLFHESSLVRTSLQSAVQEVAVPRTGAVVQIRVLALPRLLWRPH